jgi:long-subunit acyl-CoA synthetase (AMP-forming)
VVFDDLEGLDTSVSFKILSRDEFLKDSTPTEREEPNPWDISSLIYTSGTTGRSKAVMVPWQQLDSSLESGMLPKQKLPDISLYSPYPVFHVTGKAGFYYATKYGNPSVIREAFSPTDFWADIKHEIFALKIVHKIKRVSGVTHLGCRRWSGLNLRIFVHKA